MQKNTGRPISEANRSKIEMDCYDFLDALGILYDRVDHETAETMEKCAEIETVLEAQICKNLFLTNRQKTHFYLLMMPADKPFKTKDLSAQLQVARLSFATAEDMQRLLFVTPGSVSVLALIKDEKNAVQLVIDEDILLERWIGCHPCRNTSTLRFSVEDFTQKLLPALRKIPVRVNL